MTNEEANAWWNNHIQTLRNAAWLGTDEDRERIEQAIEYVTKALSQPTEDAISRQAVLDYIYNDLGLGDEENGKDLERQMELEDSYKYIKSLSPVTPKQIGWIKFTKRPTTDDEKEYYAEHAGIDAEEILDCELPDDGQEVLISYDGFVCIDTFFNDNDGLYFENSNIEDVDAWMPLPEPFIKQGEQA